MAQRKPLMVYGILATKPKCIYATLDLWGSLKHVTTI